MTRATLSLYELDRAALQRLSAELETVLAADDRDGLATLLELGSKVTESLGSCSRLVDLFLRTEDDSTTKTLFASLRRISKKRALTKVMTSTDPALDGRLRGYDVLRECRPAATLVDKLINPNRLPWYLRVRDATCGWLDAVQCKALATEMRHLRPSLTPELRELMDGIEAIEADAVLHDSI